MFSLLFFEFVCENKHMKKTTLEIIFMLMQPTPEVV